jgi:hypothetical protein
MGFLDHSTNNIIVDAVLTDTGRRLLAANDQSFQIMQFALSDEEVDYGIIKKFGRNVGQEKIEKNTPVLEALTRSNLGQKYRLMSISNNYLSNLPKLDLLSSTVTSTNDVVELTKGTSNDTTSLTYEVKPTVGTVVEDDLLDEFFFVEVNNIFIDLPESDIDIINIDNTVVYRIGTITDSGSGRTQLKFRLTLKGYSESQFNIYKISASSSYVKTYVKITGGTSGLTKTIEVRVRNS